MDIQDLKTHCIKLKCLYILKKKKNSTFVQHVKEGHFYLELCCRQQVIEVTVYKKTKTPLKYTKPPSKGMQCKIVGRGRVMTLLVDGGALWSRGWKEVRSPEGSAVTPDSNFCLGTLG